MIDNVGISSLFQLIGFLYDDGIFPFFFLVASRAQHSNLNSMRPISEFEWERERETIQVINIVGWSPFWHEFLCVSRSLRRSTPYVFINRSYSPFPSSLKAGPSKTHQSHRKMVRVHDHWLTTSCWKAIDRPSIPSSYQDLIICQSGCRFLSIGNHHHEFEERVNRQSTPSPIVLDVIWIGRRFSKCCLKHIDWLIMCTRRSALIVKNSINGFESHSLWFSLRAICDLIKTSWNGRFSFVGFICVIDSRHPINWQFDKEWERERIVIECVINAWLSSWSSSAGLFLFKHRHSIWSVLWTIIIIIIWDDDCHCITIHVYHFFYHQCIHHHPIFQAIISKQCTT